MPQYGRSKIREAGRSFFYLAARRQTSWLLFLYLVAAMASASAQTGSSVPTAETIVHGPSIRTRAVASEAVCSQVEKAPSCFANLEPPVLRHRHIPRDHSTGLRPCITLTKTTATASRP